MKKWLSVILMFVLCVSLCGCVGQKTDLLTYREQKDLPSSMQSLSYEMALGHTVHDAVITAEYWEAGQKIDQVAIKLDETTSQFGLLFDLSTLMTEAEDKCVDLQLDTDASDGENHEVVMRHFDLPENVCGYTFEGSDDKQQIKVAPNAERILGGIAFDIGRGVHGIGLDGLIEEPESIKEYDAIVIVRAQFE